MASEVLRIVITASGGTQVQRESAKARSGLVGIDGSAKKATGSLIGTAKSLLRLGVATAGIGSVAIGLKNVVSSTVNFDKAMRNVNSIAQLSEREFEGLRENVLDLAGPTAQAPQTLAEGMYDLVSSGFDAAESLKIVEAAARAATAGLTTTDVSTKAVAAVLNAYRKPASEAGAVSDTLFRTVDRGVISFDELATNIGTVLPFAASAGINLREVGASIATMTKQGIGGANAITFLKNAYVSFNKPSADLNKAIKRTGFESGEALIKSKGFQGALESVIGTTDGSRKAVAALFPNIRALTSVLALTGENAAAAGKDLRGMEKDTGATAKALEQQSKSIAFQWNQLKANASVLAIEVGDKLKPAFASVLAGLSAFVVGIGDSDSSIRRFIASAGQVPLVQNAFTVVKQGVMGVVNAIKLLAGIGSTILNVLSPVTSLAAAFLRSDAAVRVFNTALGILAGLLAANVARAAAWLGILAVGKILAFASAVRNIGTAMIAMRAAMAANPLGLFLSVIGAAAGALGLFGGKTKEAAVSQQELASAIGSTRDAIDRLNDADLEHAQQVITVARTETQLSEALKNRRNLQASGTATALQTRQADIAVKQARLDLVRETGRLTRVERDAGANRRKDAADAGAALAPLRKRRNQITETIEATKREIKANQENAKSRRGKVAEGFEDKAIAGRKKLAGQTRELTTVEATLRAENRRLDNALQGTGKSAQALARRYANFPKAVKTALRAEDTDAVRKVNSLAKKLEATGRKRTVARILANSTTAEDAIRRLKFELDQIRSKNIRINVTERKIRSGKLLGPPAPLDNPKVRAQGHYSGGKITKPMAIVGEEAPRHPEYVIATNPRYRQRNVGLLGSAAKALKVPGFAQGGVMGRKKPDDDRRIRVPMYATGGRMDQVPVNIAITTDGLHAPSKADYPDYSVTKKIAGGGTERGAGGGGGKWGGGSTLSFAHALEKLFGLRISSTWRSPEHNRAVGGVPNSMHTHGSLTNPGAVDFMPPSPAAAAYAIQAGVPEVLIHDAGSGLHLHLGFFKQGGVVDQRIPGFAKGGINTKIGKMVGASVFGGAGDPATGTVGYKGDSLPGTNSYAELKMGTALGGLPHKQKLWIKNAGKVEKGFKRDIGKGGGNVQGLSRDIDLWYQLASKLGLSGLGVVRVSSVGEPGRDPDKKKRPDPKKLRKGKQPTKGGRRPTEMPYWSTTFDHIWENIYGEKLTVYDNLKRKHEQSVLPAAEIAQIMAATGADKVDLAGGQLSEGEIKTLIVEQTRIHDFLRDTVVAAANKARGSLLVAVEHLKNLITETKSQITHETAVIKRRNTELVTVRKRTEKLQAKDRPSKADKREITQGESRIGELERDITDRKERRTRLQTRVDTTYPDKVKEFTTKRDEIISRQKSYSVSDSIIQAIDDARFNIVELQQTPLPGSSALDANDAPAQNDELIAALKQQRDNAQAETATLRAQQPLFAGVFHQGGVIPGQGEKMALVEGGEEVVTRRERGRRAPAPNVNITISGDRALAAAIAESIDVVVEEAETRVGQTAFSGLGSPSSPGRLASYRGR